MWSLKVKLGMTRQSQQERIAVTEEEIEPDLAKPVHRLSVFGKFKRE
jgi:hypothetical protein